MIAHLGVVDHWCSSPHCTGLGPKKGRCTAAQKIRVTYEGAKGSGGIFETLQEALEHLEVYHVTIDPQEIAKCQEFLTNWNPMQQ